MEAANFFAGPSGKRVVRIRIEFTLSIINRLEMLYFHALSDAVRVRIIGFVLQCDMSKASHFPDCGVTALGACFATVTGASGSLVPSSGVFATRLLASRPAT